MCIIVAHTHTHMYIWRVLTSIQSASSGSWVGGLPSVLEVLWELPCSNEGQVSTWSVCAVSSCVLVLGTVLPSCGDGSPFHSWDGGEDTERWRRGAFSPCSSFCKMNKWMNESGKQPSNQSVNQSISHSINQSINRCTQSSHSMKHRKMVLRV